MTMARFQTYLKDSDVVVTIHRGIDQIGGCITEISTKTSCVFVDFGQNLPGCTVPTTPEQDEAQVRDIFAQNVKQHQAVVYTHAHEDHVGLFDLIPCDVSQYIGVGGQELMLAKYDLLKIAHEQEWKDSEEKSKILIDDEQKIRKIIDFHIWERTAPHTRSKSFMIGDIRITPFLIAIASMTPICFLSKLTENAYGILVIIVTMAILAKDYILRFIDMLLI